MSKFDYSGQLVRKGDSTELKGLSPDIPAVPTKGSSGGASCARHRGRSRAASSPRGFRTTSWQREAGEVECEGFIGKERGQMKMSVRYRT